MYNLVWGIRSRIRGGTGIVNRRDTQASTTQQPHEAVETIYRTESRSVLATLIRLLGDFDLAEEALHEAFKAALEQWPRDGVPAKPRAWLISTGRFKAIDAIRKQSRLDPLPDNIAERLTTDTEDLDATDNSSVEDDRLRLIFTCCHPALALDTQVALTLREVCGLTTEEIARAFLTAAPTLAQRIVRAKAKIRNARIPYQVPARADLPDRLDAVLRVVYLVFNEGYAASSGAAITRHDLSSEAISLGRLLLNLLPEPDVAGLLGLMLLQDSRRAARMSAAATWCCWRNKTASCGTAMTSAKAPPWCNAPWAPRGRPLFHPSRDCRRTCQRVQRRGNRLAPNRRVVRPPAAGRALASDRIESGGGDGHARRARGGP